MEEQAKYQTKDADKMDAVNDMIKPVNEEAPRTRMSKDTQHTVKAGIGTGALPFRFIMIRRSTTARSYIALVWRSKEVWLTRMKR